MDIRFIFRNRSRPLSTKGWLSLVVPAHFGYVRSSR